MENTFVFVKIKLLIKQKANRQYSKRSITQRKFKMICSSSRLCAFVFFVHHKSLHACLQTCKLYFKAWTIDLVDTKCMTK